MAFSQMTDDLDIIAKYPDEPYEEEGFTSAAFKASFDAGAKLCKAAHNVLVAALNGFAAAASLGFRRSVAVPADTVQDAIENVQAQAAGAAMGDVPNDSITAEKLKADCVSGRNVAHASLIQDVTNDVHLTPTSASDNDDLASNLLQFHYSRALGVVFVQGTMTLSRMRAATPYLKLELAWTGDYTPESGQYEMLHAVAHTDMGDFPLRASYNPTSRKLTIRSNHMPSEGVMTVVVSIVGWYLC